MNAELAARFGLPEVFAKGVMVEIHLTTLRGERGGDSPGRGFGLVPDISSPNVGAVDEVGHDPSGKVVSASTPLIGEAIEEIHLVILRRNCPYTIFPSRPSGHKRGGRTGCTRTTSTSSISKVSACATDETPMRSRLHLVCKPEKALAMTDQPAIINRAENARAMESP
jgi:hypothetical protein